MIAPHHTTPSTSSTRHRPAWVLVLVGLSLLLPALASADPTGKEIVEKAQDTGKLEGAEFIATLTIRNEKGQERVRKIASVSKLFDQGDTEKRLITFIEPADVKGTSMLTFDHERKDDQIWFYMPSLRKTRRIVSTEKAKSFMGSEFSYADMTPPNPDDYTHTLKGSETVDGVDCWVVETIPNDDDIADESGYSKRVGYIGKSDFVIRKAVLYDFDDELHKELRASGIKLLDEKNQRYRPTKLVMENKQNGRSSELSIDQIQLRLDVPDDYFTTRYLERE